jgi:phosphohistidine swiveling domain-containing protein
VLTRTQELVRLRDNGQHYVVKLLLPPRHIIAELGTRWAARGWLGHADDIFFLGIAEIGRIVQAGDPGGLGRDPAALVAGRRRAYEHWFTVRAPEVVGRDGAPVVTATAAGDGALVGIPASGGRVRGTARIVLTIGEVGRIQPGDILVTRATDPGWTPVLPLVDGLVLEIGGQLSHGAIVAREYGIPAVVNVANATLRIRDGQSLLVDGTSGHVYIEDGASEAGGRVEEE